ncbi:hypothetical protein NQ318_012942 [Aromia moschata]|uniref:non-specific serine/threonine protein kinase n=1 Tax=Aromia moschata TaxID=1265417 RepID=A0AAV8XRM3_9CUCU|nr:hypothetical protein NQ318_012942 [Aromia moschata]
MGWGESKCLNILGTGRFGTVIRGIHKGRNVAVKVVKTTNSAREKNSFNLHHPNIVKTIDVIEQKGENFSLIVMEYFPNSRQLQSLVEDVNVCLKNKIISFAKQICEGVKFCHTNKVLHLDIKPQNILVCEDVCKLCDFGNSVRLSDIQAFKHQGTVPYTAPELLQGKCPNEQCDIYSLGILYWQLRSRKNPYYEIDNIETVIYKV